MTIEELRRFSRAQPFRPFVIHLADGGQVVVRHPEFLAVEPSGRAIKVYQPDDSVKVVELALVANVEIKSAAKGSGGRSKT
jgi:hypothetical protein